METRKLTLIEGVIVKLSVVAIIIVVFYVVNEVFPRDPEEFYALDHYRYDHNYKGD